MSNWKIGERGHVSHGWKSENVMRKWVMATKIDPEITTDQSFEFNTKYIFDKGGGNTVERMKKIEMAMGISSR